MVDRESGADLAVIGMAINAPECDSLAKFGHAIYRGLTSKKEYNPATSYDLAIDRIVTEAAEDASVSADEIAIITLTTQAKAGLSANLKRSLISDPSHTSNPLYSALIFANNWLMQAAGKIVLLLETQLESGTHSAVVVSLRNHALLNQNRIYADICSISSITVLNNGRSACEKYQAAIKAAGIQPDLVGLIVNSSPTHHSILSPGIEPLLQAYQNSEHQSCALSGSAPGLPGLIKTIWSLYRRIIPGTPNGAGPAQPERWEQSAFYLPSESRTWFLSARIERRIANYLTAETDGSTTALFLREALTTSRRPMDVLEQELLNLFPIAADSMNNLVTKLTNLQNRVLSYPDFQTEARFCFDQFQFEKDTANLQVCLLSHSADELNREIGFAIKGIPTAFENKTDWQTPLGSYFTALPLGDQGDVAFVYPGAFNSYPGVGQDLFYLFPNLYESISELSEHVDELLNERMLFPRSMSVLSRADLGEYETRLNADPMAMLISGTSLAFIYTKLLEDVFKLHADRAFGYSLGEISMMFADELWTGADDVSSALRDSPLFQTLLAGPQNTVRKYWNIPQKIKEDSQEILWENYLLMASPEKVHNALTSEPRVYLTHINTPNQVVIGGDPASCRRVIDSIRAHSIKAPFNYALHNPAISSEYANLVELLTWPIGRQPTMKLYSAASYQMLQVDSKKTAQGIATGLCTCLDFPRLVRQAHQDGARIFIELGAGSNCTRWIKDTLDGQPHAAFSINQKGVADYSSILKLLARLICHRIPLDLSVLFKKESYEYTIRQ